MSLLKRWYGFPGNASEVTPKLFKESNFLVKTLNDAEKLYNRRKNFVYARAVKLE